jgi:hypothetical protein
MNEPQNSPDHYGIGQPRENLIFSLVNGFVWASWPGTIASVKLGTQGPVTAVMRDFLSQCELGDRLTNARNVIQ